MHFSIPDTQELLNESSTTTCYTAYNVYINGNYHCSLRYKQLHALHEQFKRHPSVQGKKLPSFPPKRILPLTNSQLDTRRMALERYLQLVGQDAQLSQLEMFQQFLLRSQIETAIRERTVEADNVCAQLEAVLSNGVTLPVNCSVNQNTAIVLHNVCRALKLPAHLVQYFCLFLARGHGEGDKDWLLLRRLTDVESPFISRAHALPCQLLLRKGYWDPMLDLKLAQDAVALDLLYIQAVSDVEYEWVYAAPEVRPKLSQLQRHGLKREYLEMVRQLPLYGFLKFTGAAVDYPEPSTDAIISIGNRELSIRTIRGAKIFETKFRVTRMRCWRVSAMHNTIDARDEPKNMILSFEYLIRKNTLRWITIQSDQVMLMSNCLQAMVDELLISNGAGSGNGSGGGGGDDDLDTSAGVSASSTPTSYSVEPMACISSSASLSTAVSSNNYVSYATTTATNSSANTTPGTPSSPPVKFLAQRSASKQQQHKLTSSNTFSAVFFRNDTSSVQNEAFEGIGDDDL